VSITAWRITKREHAKTAFSGEGARKFGGRWNSPGTSIVYTAETQSLAVLEMLAHLEQPDLLQRYVLIGVHLAPSLIERLDRSRLPRHWRAEPPPLELKAIGDAWAASKTSVALQVPGALVPAEGNLLLNPAHAEFQTIVIGDPISFDFDQRLAL
jgi:RES domain-containing protein